MLYPNDYWSEADALGETICGGNFKGYTDEQLMAELEAFAVRRNNTKRSEILDIACTKGHNIPYVENFNSKKCSLS